MRVQNINPTNYSNKKVNQNLAFKANIHSVVKFPCDEMNGLCPLIPLAKIKLTALFIESALKSGKIKPENVAGLTVSKEAHGYTDLLLLDRTTSLHSEISSIEDPEILKKHIELAPFDEETEELSFSVSEKDVCPGQFAENMLRNLMN